MSREILEGKTALVTGAAKRIGREIALALARAGVNVVIHFRESARQAEELRTKLASFGVKAWTVKADFSNISAARELIPEALREAGSLDILVNSASQFLPSTIHDIEFADLMQQIQINAWSPFELGREFARHAGNGKIINLLDSRITGDDKFHVAYSISKQVFALLTRMTAVDLAPRITVNGVAPGLILPPAGKDESYMNHLAQGIPLKRHGEPADIADAVLYLLSSDFITGQVIFVDGGRHIMEQDRGPDHNN